MSLIEIVDFKSRGDERGQLIAVEGGIDIPFDIKRLYYLVGTNSSVARGFHAHKQLEQIAVCVAGRCRMIMDDGSTREETWLDSEAKAIRIRKMIWHEMHEFSVDCVLLVLASDHYDESDYIRSYEEFLEIIKHA